MPMTDKKRNCIHCYHTLKKELKTRVMFKGCGKPLHKDCFTKWHENHCVVIQRGSGRDFLLRFCTLKGYESVRPSYIFHLGACHSVSDAS